MRTNGEARNVDWLRAAVVGVLATHAMSMAGFWRAGLGIGFPKGDVAAMLAANMGQDYVWGWIAHLLNGVMLALIFAGWLWELLPGPGLAKGLAYGLLTTVLAELVIVPLISPAGIFFTNTPNPGLMALGGLLTHLAYGAVLGLGYRPKAKEDAANGLETVKAAQPRPSSEDPSRRARGRGPLETKRKAARRLASQRST